MTKLEAIQLLGGTVTAAAHAIGISTSAVSLWPDELPPRIADRVEAALWRKSQQRPSARRRDAALTDRDAA